MNRSQFDRDMADMADMTGIYTELDDLLTNSKTSEALSRVEALLDSLSYEEVIELSAWLNARAVTSVRLADEEQTRADDWARVAAIAEEGETLLEVWPRLPKRLRRFVRREEKRGTLFREMNDIPGMPKR
jgi:hypothetical protein